MTDSIRGIRQGIPGGTVLGRLGTGVGAPVAIPIAAIAKAAAGSYSGLSAQLDAQFGGAQGNILYRDAAVWNVLAPGVAGEALLTGGPGANPSWSAGGAGDVVGPAVATSGNVALFDGVTGKLIKDGGTLGTAAFTSSGSYLPIGGTAVTVTTNANLTGPITSSGNATAVASQTGTGSKFVMDAAPTINQANLVGTTTNDAAAALSVGQYVDSSVTGVTVNTSKTNVTTISLTAGDWDVSAVVETTNGGTNAYIACSISQTTAAFGAAEGKDYVWGAINTVAGIGFSAIPRLRVSLSGTTTIYLVSQVPTANITTGVAGYLSARRIR